MNESIEKSSDYFKYPDIEHEVNEFERVSREFREDGEFEIDSSVLMFLAHEGEMISLGEDVWSALENTESNMLQEGDWQSVHKYSNPGGVQKRDWEELQGKFDAGTTLDAPIIMKFRNRYHLVSGNTRLMISRAKGIVPKVLLFEVYLGEEKI
ncbi:hypothetical protein H6784_03400 [Candidatus Nomurabacteria bacterium]|nr:hypothetical protein [Candidatus Kaiserbacteria bacterium]MCB9811127.1 hypothetical protein [Candidatus Nomurabacteria bacterium]MCB9814437.1 hypothetical protein [Candidatus Nomurabacteria bacterium]